MANDISRIVALLLRRHQGIQSAADQQELDQWAASSAENTALYHELTDTHSVETQLRQVLAWDLEPIRERILAQNPHAFTAPDQQQQQLPQPLRRRMIRWTAAAALLLLSLSTWLLITHHRQLPTAAAPSLDILAPARTRATLILAGGKQVDLDSAASGALTSQGAAKITKDPKGQVAYEVNMTTNTHHSGQITYNTLLNPRGSPVVHLTLSDGTGVWLNAESSIHYPAVMDRDRTVDITGEAYFEVAKDPAHPFHVKKGNMTVEVLGTAFNINTYDDEPAFRVTLTDGKVRVEQGPHQLTLQPGQQAVITDNMELAATVDLETTLAWKNGSFAFHHADLSTVLRQLSRWYNVTVSYEGTTPERYFTGRIGQSLTLDQVLKGLTQARVHYRIDPGNRLVIMP